MRKKIIFENSNVRMSITVYACRRVWNDFEKFIKPSGILPSRTLEAVIRAAFNPMAAQKWGVIYYGIFKAVRDIEMLQKLGKLTKKNTPKDRLSH